MSRRDLSTTEYLSHGENVSILEVGELYGSNLPRGVLTAVFPGKPSEIPRLCLSCGVSAVLGRVYTIFPGLPYATQVLSRGLG